MKAAYLSEFFGTAALLLVVAGSGVMGEGLSDGIDGIALLANSISTGAALYVLISLLAPVSGAHFNPLVTAYFWITKSIETRVAAIYMTLQCFGAVTGVLVTHLLFDLPIFQVSAKVREGLGIAVSEWVSVVTLLSVIVLGLRFAKQSVPLLVALTVTAGYWFTSSTFFANPAVSIARTFTDTFVGISPTDLSMFLIAQIVGLVSFLGLRKLCN